MLVLYICIYGWIYIYIYIMGWSIFWAYWVYHTDHINIYIYIYTQYIQKNALHMCPCEHIPYLTCWLKATYCIHYSILFCIAVLCVYNTCYIDVLIHLSYYISVCKCTCMCISTCNLVVTKKDERWVINLVHWFINWRRILLHFKIWLECIYPWVI